MFFGSMFIFRSTPPVSSTQIPISKQRQANCKGVLGELRHIILSLPISELGRLNMSVVSQTGTHLKFNSSPLKWAIPKGN